MKHMEEDEREEVKSGMLTGQNFTDETLKCGEIKKKQGDVNKLQIWGLELGAHLIL